MVLQKIEKKEQISKKLVLGIMNFDLIHPIFTPELMTACLNQIIKFKEIDNGGGGVTILSGNACKGGQVTDMDSLSYPDLQKINFRGIFLILCQIRFFIHFQSWHRKILFRTKIRIKREFGT